MKTTKITPQQARVEFKSWNIGKQRKFLEGLLKEYAYCLGLNNEQIHNDYILSHEFLEDFLYNCNREGLEHFYKNWNL